jgi:uncharacterized protein
MDGTIIWRRLDVEGSDRCRLVSTTAGDETGHLIEGEAWSEEGGVRLHWSYAVTCAPDWSTLSARVEGRAGDRPVMFVVARKEEGGWYLDGARLDFADDLLDVDLGFTPATNTNAIRRLNLAVGERVETTALWFDTEDFTFKRLMQVYHRVGRDAYDYASPAHGFHARLRVNALGQVIDYPALWSALDG